MTTSIERGVAGPAQDTSRANEELFNQHYGRRLQLPVALNYALRSKLTMFRALAQPLAPFPPDYSVLDLGFGRGQMLLTFPTHCRLSGLDLTASAVDLLSRAAHKRGYREYSFRQADLNAGRIPWADGSFDLVICSHVLEHVDDDRVLLAEIARVMRPGGHLIAMVPINERAGTAHPLHVRWYMPDTFRAAIESVGLSVLRDRTGSSYYQLLERIGRRPLPLPLARARGKVVAALGCVGALCPPIGDLGWWGDPRDFGVLAVKRRNR